MRLAATRAVPPRGDAPVPAPVRAAEFSKWMARLGPFEDCPRIAVGVSGGRDSMALVLLAADWAREHDGEILALTVDHGLRDESGDEAQLVARWMAERGIPHQVLSLNGLDRARGVEATARAARYREMEAACRAAGILHLLVGHHLSDQAETRIMRRARGSGVAGQAGMAAVRESGWVRILRPLLTVTRTRLQSSLNARGQAWIEDPSNQDPRFERARLRAVAARDIADCGRSPAARRVGHEHALAALAARTVRIDPAGFAVVDVRHLREVSPDTGRDLIGRVVTCVAGAVYPPRGARLDALVAHVLHDRGVWRRTLGGCVLAHGADGYLRVFREPAAITPPREPNASCALWDGRFVLGVPPLAHQQKIDVLGRAGKRQLARVVSAQVLALPHEARRVLPGLFRDDELLAGPVFGPDAGLRTRFLPRMPVSGATFGGF